MEQTVAQPAPKIKYKTFTYHTQLDWLGDRAGLLHAPGKAKFRIASPPEFKGEEGVWTPEDLFVAAVDSCTMTTFVAFAQKKNLPILGYISNAKGMLEYADGNYRFTKIFLTPVIMVGQGADLDLVQETLGDAHRKCLIANSIQTEVIVDPEIRYQ